MRGGNKQQDPLQESPDLSVLFDLGDWQMWCLFSAGGLLVFSILMCGMEACYRCSRRCTDQVQSQRESRWSSVSSAMYLTSMLLILAVAASKFWPRIPGTDKVSVSLQLST